MEKKMETTTIIEGLYRGYLGVIMEKKMETTGITGIM